jgi:hypothetical protein
MPQRWTRWYSDETKSFKSWTECEQSILKMTKKFRFYEKNLFILNKKALLIQHWFFERRHALNRALTKSTLDQRGVTTKVDSQRKRARKDYLSSGGSRNNSSSKKIKRTLRTTKSAEGLCIRGHQSLQNKFKSCRGVPAIAQGKAVIDFTSL